MDDEKIAKMTAREKREAIAKMPGNNPKDILEITPMDSGDFCQEPYEDCNQQSLCSKAEELEIEGRTIMTKSELIKAIREKSSK